MTQPPPRTSPPAAELLVHADGDAVAEALAARLLARLADLQQAGRVPQLCLTGGRIASQAYARVAEQGRSSAVDWTRVELWWGDERFVPGDDDDRNAKQALDLLREPLGLPDERVHAMPAADDGADLDGAAEAYARELGDTTFDICLLGLGPDGHVASLFPDHPSSQAQGRVIAVRNSPKPPPDRISLTLEVLNASAEIWFAASGSDKADAVALAVQGAATVPGGRARGQQRTVWLLDRSAAETLPPTP